MEMVDSQSTLVVQGAIIPNKSGVKECRPNLKPLKREPTVCDSCGVVSVNRKRSVVFDDGFTLDASPPEKRPEFDGITFNLCEKCYGRAKRYIEKGC